MAFSVGGLVKSNWSLCRGGGIEETPVLPTGFNDPWLVSGVVVASQCEGGGMLYSGAGAGVL